MLVNGKTLVRTRFAPSPTGDLHIGGVRTAIFNYLFARRYSGSFLLRIDDTDVTRNKDYQPILDSLNWLGIFWDEGPFFQSQKIKYYVQKAEQLIRSGCAYPDLQHSEKTHRGTNRSLAPEQAWELWDDTQWAIRFKVDPGEKVVVDDLIHGEVSWDTTVLGDPIIIRSNGMPTYNFATAVDDMDMQITHIIRGDEHLSNTPLQMLIHHAIGNPKIPFYAHVPFVCEPGSQKKLSKRDHNKIANLSYYQEKGYSTDAVVNYLARLGWSLDGTTEIISRKDLEKHFSLERISSGPCAFDPNKMLWTSFQHIKKHSTETLLANCLPFMEKYIGKNPSDLELTKLRKIIILYKDRIKVYSDILDAKFFYTQEVEDFDEEDVKKYLTNELKGHLGVLSYVLMATPFWLSEQISDIIRDYADTHKISLPPLIYATRVAISGRIVGPSLFSTMEILGRDVCLYRIRKV